MRIAVDVMGGDHGCGAVIEGVKLALQTQPQLTELHLVGRPADIESALARNRCQDARLRIVAASEVVTMDDKPLEAARKKKDSSMVRAIELVRDGKAEAVISPGNTGGLVAAATLKLHRLEVVERPAIATVIPSGRGEFVLLDAGANYECKALHLLQFAIMGAIYSRELLGRSRPRVGILSNGTEESKGNELTRETLTLCRQALPRDVEFLGYVEGHDLFEDAVDVVVTDGFIGNIALKTIESMGKAIIGLIKRELTADPLRKLGAILARGALLNIKRRMDPETYGGAPILGLNGTVIKAHGSAREKAFMNAIRVAGETIQHKINEAMVREITAAQTRLAGAPTAVPTPSPAVA